MVCAGFCRGKMIVDCLKCVGCTLVSIVDQTDFTTISQDMMVSICNSSYTRESTKNTPKTNENSPSVCFLIKELMQSV